MDGLLDLDSGSCTLRMILKESRICTTKTMNRLLSWKNDLSKLFVHHGALPISIV